MDPGVTEAREPTRARLLARVGNPLNWSPTDKVLVTALLLLRPPGRIPPGASLYGAARCRRDVARTWALSCPNPRASQQRAPGSSFSTDAKDPARVHSTVALDSLA
jgi:hypothetical protein